MAIDTTTETITQMAAFFSYAGAWCDKELSNRVADTLRDLAAERDALKEKYAKAEKVLTEHFHAMRAAEMLADTLQADNAKLRSRLDEAIAYQLQCLDTARDKQRECGRMEKELERLRKALDTEENAHAELQTRCFDNGQPTHGSIFDEVAKLRAEVEGLRRDAELLDSQTIAVKQEDEFGIHRVLHFGIDLRAAITEAVEMKERLAKPYAALTSTGGDHES